MTTLKFALDEALAVADHAMFAPNGSHIPTSDQAESGQTVYASLWWVKDNGTYLMSNAPYAKGKGPDNAFAKGYGPGTDARGILGGDDRVVAVFALHDPHTRQCLHSQLIRARRDGHTALFLEMDGDTVAMSTGR
ncbi:DUF3085 domain-containing protein (plasmid) [Streptomyces sp. NBC_01456]|uniref:DUF3085 domain-containing protein n=1 Tax=unclassified Streptomyces TaxID=2593676 RepID=UPI002E31BD6B|nr:MULTISPECIES: DUF3085 domain-containing protein [unclassified Streptomyces]